MIRAILLTRVILKKMVLKLFSISGNKKYFKVITNTDYISSWKSKELSAESIEPSTRPDNSLTPALSYYGTKTIVKFTESCLKQSKISYTHRKVINIYIVYELGASSFHNNDLTLKIVYLLQLL